MLDEELVDPAVRYLELAGDRALPLDVAAAENFYAGALGLAGPDGPVRSRLLVRWANAVTQLGRSGEAVAPLEEAVARLRAAGDVRSAAVAQVRLAAVLPEDGGARWQELADEAVASLEADGASLELVTVLQAWLEVTDISGDYRKHLEAAERAMQLAEQLGLPADAGLLVSRGRARCDLGVASGADDLAQALEMCRTSGLGEHMSWVFIGVAKYMYIYGGFEASLAVRAEALDVARRRGAAGASIDLVRNPDWWDTSGGPYIDTVHYEVFSGVSSMMLAFQKGMIDWTFVPQGQTVASRSLPQVKSGRWKAVSSPYLNLIYLATNMNDPVVGGTQGLPLRQALTYGCDRQAAIDAATDGVDLLPTGLVPPGVPGSNRVREPYPYDSAKAAELVKQTGPVTLDLLYPRERILQDTAETLTASYAQLGITLRPRAIEWTQLLARLRAGKSQTFLMGWFGDYPSMDNFLYPLFDSGANLLSMFYSNPHVDALLRKARATPDQQARVRLYAEAEGQILADAPAVPVLLVADYRLLNSRVANVRFNLMTWVDLWRAWVK